MTKRTTITLTALLIAVFMSACKTGKRAQEASAGNSESQVSASVELLPIVVSTTASGSDSFEMGKMRINGDTLFMEVTYGGGCKEHIFSGRHDGNIMKSLPPQLNVTIDHQANGDGCRSLLSRTLAFDLTNCKVGKTGSVVLIVNGDRAKKITYTY